MLSKENTWKQVADNQSRLIRMQKEDTLLSIVFSKMNDKFPLWYYQPKVVSLYIYTLEV